MRVCCFLGRGVRPLTLGKGRAGELDHTARPGDSAGDTAAEATQATISPTLQEGPHPPLSLSTESCACEALRPNAWFTETVPQGKMASPGGGCWGPRLETGERRGWHSRFNPLLSLTSKTRTWK